MLESKIYNLDDHKDQNPYVAATIETAHESQPVCREAHSSPIRAEESNFEALPILPPAPTLVPAIGVNVASAAQCDQEREFIVRLLNALPGGSALTFSLDQLEFLFSA